MPSAARVRLWFLTLIWRVTGKDLSRKPLDHEVGA